MLDSSGYRAELNKLRKELLEAWAVDPVPLATIARINVRLDEVLRASGLKHIPTPPKARVISDEGMARRSAASKAYWASLRAKRGKS